MAEYESNRDYIEELISKGHIEDLEMMVPIKLMKYADPLNQAGNYSKSLKITLEIEESLKKMRSVKYYKVYAEYAQFLKAVCYGRLKKYTQSNEVFKDLLTKNPDNEMFADWYRGNQKAKIDLVLNPILYTGVGFYLVMLGLELSGFESKTDFLQISGLATGLLSFVLSYLLKKWVDKRTLRFGRLNSTQHPI